MRLLTGLTLVAFCLTLAGCGLTQRSRSTASRTGGTQPFMGAPEAKDTETSGSGSGTGSTAGGADTLARNRKTKGSLAGQVLDSTRRRVPGAVIQVVEMDAPRDGAAPLSVMTNKDGYFDIYGLEAGRWYRLVARARDGNRFLTGSTRVLATNIRVAIVLTGEELVPPPAPPPSGDVTGKVEDGKSETEKATSTAAQGGAFGQAPHEGKPTAPREYVPSPGAVGIPAPVAPSAIPPVKASPSRTNPEFMARDEAEKQNPVKEKDGFRYQAPNVNIPGRPAHETPREKPLSPPPMSPNEDLPLSSAPDARPGPAATAAPQESTKSEVPARTVVPSCVRVGNQVRDLALYDIDGSVWELSKKRGSGSKLMLLDFWSTGCAPCREALRFMVALDRQYRRHGLDVVGIAHEEGTLAQKQAAVRQARTQYGINYPLLLSGGGTGPCPVLRQFGVEDLPTLVLLDGSGKIVWKARGLNDYHKRMLEIEIQRRLGQRQGR